MQDVNYIIDKDDILPALREGVKVLGEGETAKFLFPSFLEHSVTRNETHEHRISIAFNLFFER